MAIMNKKTIIIYADNAAGHNIELCKVTIENMKMNIIKSRSSTLDIMQDYRALHFNQYS